MDGPACHNIELRTMSYAGNHYFFLLVQSCTSIHVSVLNGYLLPFKVSDVMKVEKFLPAEVLLLWLFLLAGTVSAQCLEDAHHLPFSCIHIMQEFLIAN